MNCFGILNFSKREKEQCEIQRKKQTFITTRTPVKKNSRANQHMLAHTTKKTIRIAYQCKINGNKSTTTHKTFVFIALLE